MALIIGGEKTSASIKLTGLPELDAAFDKLQGKVRNSIGKKALRQATNVTLRYARQYVLKDTKALMKGAIPKKKAHLRDYAVMVEWNPDYGDGRPLRFMKRAVYASKPEAIKIFRAKLQELIRAEKAKAVPSG